MKIAFTAYGNSWDEQVDIRFGRTKGLFIVDDQTEETEYLDNTENVLTQHGAGTNAAQAVSNAGVQILITGKVGPKAGQVLKASGIRVFGGIGYGSIREAYEQYKKGLLTEQYL